MRSARLLCPPECRQEFQAWHSASVCSTVQVLNPDENTSVPIAIPPQNQEAEGSWDSLTRIRELGISGIDVRFVFLQPCLAQQTRNLSRYHKHRDLSGYSRQSLTEHPPHRVHGLFSNCHTQNVTVGKYTMPLHIFGISSHLHSVFFKHLRSEDPATTFLVDDSITRSVQENTLLSIV